MSTQICQITDYAALSVSGERARQLLQGQCTQEFGSLKPGDWVLAAACNLQGRVVANFAAVCVSNAEFKLLLPASVVASLSAAWQKYLPFYRVTLTGSSDPVYGYLGEAPASANAVALGTDFGFCLAVEAEPDIAGTAAWHAHRINSGWHFVDASTSASYTVHALGLEVFPFVSFTKGCYLGQEIIARTHYRGKVKQRIYPAQSSAKSRLPAGEGVFNADNKKIGSVVESLTCDDRSLLLVYLPITCLRDKINCAGTSLELLAPLTDEQ